ncbi:MAG: FHA domain-containing protein [Bacteroidaceae bacterium]|nr:FHA domain-containing protein [Bacteroidaceae bacterium]
MANTIKVTCPTCKAVLTIPYYAGIEDRMLKCSICGHRSKVSVFIEAAMPKNTAPVTDDDTETALTFKKEDRTIGSLYVGRTEYPLVKGVNTAGRNAPTCEASIKLDVTDKYMSRVQVRITVKEGGSGLEHHIESLNDRNLVKVNGNNVGIGEVLCLSWGDKLLMGSTEVLFQRPRYFEDATEYTK